MTGVCGRGGGVVSTPVESDGFFCVCVLGVRTHGGKACGGRRSCPSALGRHKARPTISGRTRLPAAGPGAEFAGLTSPRAGTAVEQTTTFGGEGRHTGRRRAGLRGCGVRVVPVGRGRPEQGREGGRVMVPARCRTTPRCGACVCGSSMRVRICGKARDGQEPSESVSRPWPLRCKRNAMP